MSDAAAPKKKRTGLVITLVVVALLLLCGCGVGAYLESVANPNQTPQTPSETETTMTTDGTESYISSMEKYRVMDIDTFESLPREERLLYDKFLVDQTVERNNYSQYKGTGNEITPVKVTVDNTGQEIVDMNRYATQIAFMQFVESPNTSLSAREFDVLDGQKMLSFSFYNVGSGKRSNSYTSYKDQMTRLENPTLIVGDKRNVIDTSEIMTGKDKANGETVKYKDISYKSETGQIVYSRFVFCEYSSYKNNGDNDAFWLIETLDESPELVASGSSISTK